MDRSIEGLTYRQRKIVGALARSVRAPLPSMLIHLNEASREGEDFWQHIEALEKFFDKHWDANALQGESQPTSRNAHPAQSRK